MATDISKLAKTFSEAFRESRKSGTSAYDTQATVIRTEGSTAWVHIPGGVDETPVRMTLSAEPGDEVQVRIAGGRAWLTGNATAPPTDDRTANAAKTVADSAQSSATAVSSRVAVIESAYISEARVETLLADYASIDYLEANYATITELHTGYAQINLANIDTANISKASIRDLFTEVGLIASATIVDGKITGYLDAVNVNAANITAGTLVADRIAIRGSNSSLVYALNNYGQITSTQVNTLDGYVLTPRTINADKIVAGTITATEIAASTITANKLNVSTLSSVAADIGTVTAGVLKSTDYSYSSGTYTTAGMIIDLTNKVIRMPNTAVLSDGSLYSKKGTIGGWTIGETDIYYEKETPGAGGGNDRDYTLLGSDRLTGAHETFGIAESSGYTLTTKGGLSLYNGGKLNVSSSMGNHTDGVEVNADGVKFYHSGGGTDYSFNLTRGNGFVSDSNISAPTFIGSLTGHASLDLPLTGGTLSGSVAISATGKGFNLTDASGTTYGGIYENGDNLWIGAASSTSPHHRGASGNTYISSGYSTSRASGNSTIYISVPSLSGTTWSHTTYGVLHTGNYSSYALPLSGGTLTGTVILNNNIYLYGKDSGGTARILTGHSSDNNMFFGYGSRAASQGASYFDGHVVYIRSNNAIYMQTTSGASISGGSLTITATDTTERFVRAANSNGSIELNASSGNKGVYDRSGGRWIIYLATNSTADTAVTIPRALTVTGTLTGYDYSGASHVMVGSAADASHRVGYLYHQNPTTVRVYGQAGGSGYTTYTTLTGTSSSDIRLKKNVADTEIANALSVINQIEMRSFDWLPGWRDYTHQPIGMIADQIEKLDSRLVIGGGYDPDGQPNYKVIDDHYLACYLTKGVQELCDRIEMLEREIKALKGVA